MAQIRGKPNVPKRPFPPYKLDITKNNYAFYLLFNPRGWGSVPETPFQITFFPLFVFGSPSFGWGVPLPFPSQKVGGGSGSRPRIPLPVTDSSRTFRSEGNLKSKTLVVDFFLLS